MVETNLNYKNAAAPNVGSQSADFARTDRTRLHYAALLESTQALNRTMDYHDILQYILERVLDISRADCAMVMLGDESGFQFIGGRDQRRGILTEEPFQLSPGVVDRLYKTMDIICVRDVSRDATLRNDMILAADYVSAVLALPMYRGETIMGMIYMPSHAAMSGIDDFDLSILRGMAGLISIITENAIGLSEIERLNESIENDIQARTAQLSQANEWLADALAKAEQQAKAREEMDQKRIEFFSALSHELRSPMQLLLGHSQMIMAEGVDRLSDAQRNSMNVIVKTSEHVRDLVSTVMDANKLTEGAMTISPAPIDLRPMIDEVVEMGRGLLQEKHVQITRYYMDTLPMVAADPIRIRQVLLNLVANACRHTEKGKITISATEHESYVVLSVVDTGSGIPADKLGTIFEPYRQADSLRSHSGAGLGLSISKQLVEMHGGRIIVKSTVGAGSIFAFNVPIAM